MPKISILHQSDDHPGFTGIVAKFVEHYAQLYHPPGIITYHVDNWFGERWLGFAGKFKGMAGIRNRSVNNTTLALPPFRPSRIQSCREYARTADNSYQLIKMTPHGMHRERNGGEYTNLHRPNLYFWYAGNTRNNTNGSLMIYDVTREGTTGWYLGFDRNPDWALTRTVNVTREECEKILVGVE